jgi:hypothetical protein
MAQHSDKAVETGFLDNAEEYYTRNIQAFKLQI